MSLEPCDHFGKTPPCSDLILKNKIPNVVIGCIDPFEKVAGASIEKLKKNGCNVIVGILEDECIASNKRFFTFQNEKRPYIILKWAETKDGFIDVERNIDAIKDAKPNWISNTYSRQLVHKWRAEEDAILIGTNTAINDNPKLDIRNWSGKNPVRVVLDKSLRIPSNYDLFDETIQTIVMTEKKVNSKNNILFEQIDFSNNVAQQIGSVLYNHNLQSVLVEGGKQTLQTFIDANLWDEARIFVGNTSFNKGVKAPIISGNEISAENIQSDVLKIIKNLN